jgi:hypothetical protein
VIAVCVKQYPVTGGMLPGPRHHAAAQSLHDR